MQENVNKIDNVIFFGAGASASEGAPLQGDLFKEYFQTCKTTKTMEARLIKFFKKFFGIDVKHNNLDEVSFPTLEEILGVLELSLNREESFKDYSLTPSKPLIQQIKEDLIFLIAIVLKKKLSKEAKYHRKLVDKLIEDNKLSSTAFVTSNYDILIDNALTKLYPNYDVDYGIEFTNYEKNNDWKRPRPQKAIYLYKLHGSLNWLYCLTCVSLTLTPKVKSVATLVFKPQKCDVCGSVMVPIVIPPTFFKVMSNFYLQEIWRKTENTLKQAKKFFFCGYSFPNADMHIKYLLKRVEINRGSTPEIFIFNKYKGKPSHEKMSEKLRYMRFFKDSQKKVNYTNHSFEDFCKRGVCW